MSSPDGADAPRRRRLQSLLDGAHRPDLDAVCAAAVTTVGVDGAGVTVAVGPDLAVNGARDQPAAVGALTRRLEDLQLTAGEGPCLDAVRGGLPVLVPDLAAGPVRWPGFGPEAARLGVAALFSLPLQVGVVQLGTLDLYRTAPGALSREQLADALMLATLATEVVLELAEPHARNGDPSGAADAVPVGWLPDVHADVHVATGMVSAWAGVDVATALLRLRAHAFARGEPLHEVARRVIDRDLVLDPASASGEPGTTPHHDPHPRDRENDDP